MAQSQLPNSLEYCVNLTELSLPTIEIDPKQFRKLSSLSMTNLQRLDVRYNDIQALLEVINVNLKELTIRKDPYPYWNGEMIGPWVDYWMSKKFAPQEINIIIAHSLWLNGTHSLWHCPLRLNLYDSYPPNTVPLTPLLNSWLKMNSESPPGHTGTVKLYGAMKSTMNLAPIYPLFKLTFGNNATSPFVRTSCCGLPGELLVLTHTKCDGKVVFKATTADDLQDEDAPSYSTITNLEFVTEFDISFKEALLSEHLKQLALACPNLQRLNLLNNKHCLKDLDGLRAIASYCHNLQGLNLMGIPVTEVEDQAQLWEILTDVKLTHLALNLCVLLPKEQHGLFKKCKYLQALEFIYNHCDAACANMFVDKCLLVLSQFPSLIHVTVTLDDNYHLQAYFDGHHQQLQTPTYATSSQLSEILTGCQKLKYLRYVQYDSNSQFLSPAQTNNLEQICIKSKDTDVSDTFVSTISAHGGLVHVELYVSTVTSGGVFVLVSNSPKLMGFHASLYGDYIDVDSICEVVKKKFSHRQLFVMGNFTMQYVRRYRCGRYIPLADAEDEHQCITNLSSLW